MKFACEQCATKYSIADERVRGRVLKIRCKSCNHVITVREPDPAPRPSSRSSVESGPLETAVQASIERSFGAALPEENSGEHTVVSSGPLPGPGGASDAAAGDDSEWYVSFDGEQEGPFPLARAHERIRAERPRGKEIHCWKPGFFVWLPIEEVPEMARAFAAPRSSPPPALPPLPAPPDKGRVTGSRPAVGARPASTTGSQRKIPAPGDGARSRGNTGSRPAIAAKREESKREESKRAKAPQVRKDPTGPRAALAVPKESAAPEPMLPIDSKPMPLPPPPDPFPSAPMGIGATRPESHLYRRAAAAGGAPTPLLGREARDEAPAKKPLFPEAHAGVPIPAPAPASPIDTAGVPTKPNGKEEVSPFAAALAASAGEQPKPLDTGPVPLPPPPGDDLPISEPSGLLNLSHVAPVVTPAPHRPPGRPIETFGGQTVTPASGPNGALASVPAQVVVMTGAAPRSATPWLKLAAVGGISTAVLLFGVVIYLLSRKPVVVTPPQTTVATQAPRPVEDHPIAMADPAVPDPNAKVEEPAQPVPSRHGSTHHASTPRAPRGPQGPVLSSKQKGLAALYADGPEGSVPHALPSLESAHRSSGQVSQNAILAVVSQNHRSLGLCYERVLKHDNSLKHARVVTRVKIGISGRVTAVNVEDAFKTTEIGQCLVQTIRQWHFPPSDAEYETELPLILQAN